MTPDLVKGCLHISNRLPKNPPLCAKSSVYPLITRLFSLRLILLCLRFGTRIFPQPPPADHSTVKQNAAHRPVKHHPQPDANHPHTQHNPQRVARHDATAPHAEHGYPHGVAHGSVQAIAQIGIKKALSHSSSFTTTLTSSSLV